MPAARLGAKMVSLLLSCRTLSFLTTCRFIPALLINPVTTSNRRLFARTTLQLKKLVLFQGSEPRRPPPVQRRCLNSIGFRHGRRSARLACGLASLPSCRGLLLCRPPTNSQLSDGDKTRCPENRRLMDGFPGRFVEPIIGCKRRVSARLRSGGFLDKHLIFLRCPQGSRNL